MHEGATWCCYCAKCSSCQAALLICWNIMTIRGNQQLSWVIHLTHSFGLPPNPPNLPHGFKQDKPPRFCKRGFQILFHSRVACDRCKKPLEFTKLILWCSQYRKSSFVAFCAWLCLCRFNILQLRFLQSTLKIFVTDCFCSKSMGAEQAVQHNMPACLWKIPSGCLSLLCLAFTFALAIAIFLTLCLPPWHLPTSLLSCRSPWLAQTLLHTQQSVS